MISRSGPGYGSGTFDKQHFLIRNSVTLYTNISLRLLPCSGLVRDLCLMINSKSRFSSHVNIHMENARAGSNVTLKCFASRDYTTLNRAFPAAGRCAALQM